MKTTTVALGPHFDNFIQESVNGGGGIQMPVRLSELVLEGWRKMNNIFHLYVLLLKLGKEADMLKILILNLILRS